jgi:hypothetical protein
MLLHLLLTLLHLLLTLLHLLLTLLHLLLTLLLLLLNKFSLSRLVSCFGAKLNLKSLFL